MNKGSSSALQNIPGDHLVAAGLSCVRGEKMLFRDLNFAVEPGQAGLLTGPNGVGKSSLLRLIAGLLEPFAGTISLPSAVALCDDRLALDENIPLQSALEFWTKMDDRSQSDCEAAMSAAGLSHLAEVPVRYFSTGQRQRARLARTYLTGAQLWLLDEPANGLDTASVAQLGVALQSHLDRGGSILAASHIPLPINFTLSLTLEPMS